MLYKDKIRNLTAVYPELARVWIKTGDPRTPLKGVWINGSQLHPLTGEPDTANRETETRRVSGGPLSPGGIVDRSAFGTWHFAFSQVLTAKC